LRRDYNFRMKRRIKLGLDFDGVVAYNPFRLVRAPWAYFKRRILKVRKLTFFYPKNNLEKYIWKILHDSSILPANGTEILEELVTGKSVEAHLITGRYRFLNNHLYNFLDKYEMRNIFKSINFNKRDIQPHIFKEELIRKLGIEVFVEDNWDIVEYLSDKKRKYPNKVKIFWIYNLIDRYREYKYKYPYLEKALREIIKIYGYPISK